MSLAHEVVVTLYSADTADFQRNLQLSLTWTRKGFNTILRTVRYQQRQIDELVSGRDFFPTNGNPSSTLVSRNIAAVATV